MFTTRQFMFGIATFIGGSSLFTVFVTRITYQDSWITALLALFMSLPVIGVYLVLCRRFRGYGLAQMHTFIYGKNAGRILNGIYALFCLGFTAVSLRNIGDFFTGFIMPETPMAVTLILVSTTCAAFARQGIVAILRNGFLFFIFMVLALLLNSLFLLPNMEPANFLPMFTFPPAAYGKGAFVLSAAPLCEILVFMFFLPYGEKNTDVKKGFIGGLLLGGGYLFLTFLRDILTLGVALSYLTEPTYEAVRLINLLNVFSRLEIVFAFTLIIMRVFKISVLFCATAECVENAMGHTFKKRGVFMLFLAGAAVLSSIYLFPSGLTLPDLFRNVGAYIFAVFEFGFPLLTLLISFLRRIKKEKV